MKELYNTKDLNKIVNNLSNGVTSYFTVNVDISKHTDEDLKVKFSFYFSDYNNIDLALPHENGSVTFKTLEELDHHLSSYLLHYKSIYSNIFISLTDVRTIGMQIKQELTLSECRLVMKHYLEECENDPTATWDLIIENLIYNLIINNNENSKQK